MGQTRGPTKRNLTLQLGDCMSAEEMGGPWATGPVREKCVTTITMVVERVQGAAIHVDRNDFQVKLAGELQHGSYAMV